MKKLSIALLIILACHFSPTSAQVTIEDCYSKARSNYPLIKQYDLIEKSKEYNLANASKGYLPQLSLNAQTTYQSDITSFPGMPIKLPKDQYSASITLNQIIWDGGAIKSKRAMASASSNIDKNQVNVDLYAIKDRINQVYFGILLFDAQLKQNELMADDLQREYNQIDAGLKNGTANQSDLDAIQVEQLKTKQSTTQLQDDKRSYMQVLDALIGEQLPDNATLQKPIAESAHTATINRPELNLFEAQTKNLEIQKQLIKTELMPKISFFVTGAYAKPGLNMMDVNWAPYYIGGFKLSWNLSSLYTQKDNKRLIDNSENMINVQRETFLFNTKMQAAQQDNEVERNRALLNDDDQIIALRQNVRKASEAKVANGTMTTTDLMRDLNAENQAKQDRNKHEIQLLQSIYNLRFTTNN